MIYKGGDRMKRLVILLILLIITSTTGCATSGKDWYRYGTSDYQAHQDLIECDYYARSHCNMNGFLGLQLRSQCMRMKGYERR